MLPQAQRLRSRREFTDTVRRGRRVPRGPVVVHGLLDDHDPGVRVGLIVSKAVGGSVARHRASRVIREAIRPLVTGLDPGSRVVVRALPAICGRSVDEVRRCLADALRDQGLLGSGA